MPESATPAGFRPDGTHPYTSWACQHAERDGRDELHRYCQNLEGQAGPKEPGRCKWCPSPCDCSCHREEMTDATP